MIWNKLFFWRRKKSPDRIEEFVDYLRSQKELARQIKEGFPVEKFIQREFWEGKYDTYANLIFRLTGRMEP